MHKKSSDKLHAKNHDISHLYYVSTTWDHRSAFELINNMRSECGKLQTQYHHQCECQKESGPFLTKRRTFLEWDIGKEKDASPAVNCLQQICSVMKTIKTAWMQDYASGIILERIMSGERLNHTPLPEGHANTTNISPQVHSSMHFIPKIACRNGFHKTSEQKISRFCN